MKTEELRRSTRYTDFLPIGVTALKSDDHSRIAGPLSARIVDISNHGACLMLTQVMDHSFHIFHSTREDESFVLALKITNPALPDTVEILSLPIWMNSTKMDDIKVFKMGVEFTDSIDSNTLSAINKLISEI